MIIESTLFFIGLVVVICLMIMLSNRIKVAYPILLVIGGFLLSFIPNVPNIDLDPHIIFIIFLPPLLYEAAWENSWKELWKWRRIIFSFAFIVVFITACSVAFVANYFIPGFSLALGFLLGGIVSPPDAVSVASILKFVKVPKRIATILEGESLFNDASSLIIVRFAMIVMATGQFVWHQVALNFVWMVFGGIGIGILIALIFILVGKKLPTDANIDVVFSLIPPFIMYIIAEELGASGVMSVVCGGLMLSYQRYNILSAKARLKGKNVWSNFAFLLNGFVFLLIGMELPEIIEGMRRDGVSLYEGTIYGLVVTGILMVGRMIIAYASVWITMLMSRFITVADKRHPGKGAPIILGWAGMRGVVSLAAALSIPLTLETGEAFPHRSLIIYITFVVIFLTLVVQGLTLPFLIRRVKFIEYNDHLDEVTTEKNLRTLMNKSAIAYISKKYKEQKKSDSHLQQMLSFWENQLEEEQFVLPEGTKKIYLEILEHQRLLLEKVNRKEKKYDEEIIRRLIHRIDLEEERIHHE